MAQEANRNFVRITADGRPKCVNGMKLPAVVVGVRRDKDKSKRHGSGSYDRLSGVILDGT